MFLKKKRNYYETTTGMKQTIQDRAIGLESWFVRHRFLKQAKNRVSD